MEEKFDDLLIENNLKEKIKKEMKQSKINSDKKNKELKFSDLSEKELFSTRALWKVFNRKNHTTSFVNGIQAEGFLGSQDNLRFEIIKHKTDCFLANHLYVEFYKYQ